MADPLAIPLTPDGAFQVTLTPDPVPTPDPAFDANAPGYLVQRALPALLTPAGVTLQAPFDFAYRQNVVGLADLFLSWDGAELLRIELRHANGLVPGGYTFDVDLVPTCWTASSLVTKTLTYRVDDPDPDVAARELSRRQAEIADAAKWLRRMAELFDGVPVQHTLPSPEVQP